MIEFAGNVVAPSSFEWWSGIWIPVFMGVASMTLSLVAIVIARSARLDARTALEITRRQDAREERMPRERVAYAAIAELNELVNRPWTDERSMQARVEPVFAALVEGAGQQGIEQGSVHPLARWLLREASAVSEMTTSDPRELVSKPSERQGVFALRMGFGLRIDEWVRDGNIRESATVAEELPNFLKPYPVLDAERDAEQFPE